MHFKNIGIKIGGNLTAGNKRTVAIPSHITLFFFNFMTENPIKGQKKLSGKFSKRFCAQ